MRIIFAGTPHVAVPTLQELLRSPHEVVSVLTRPPARSGRGRTLHPSPVAEVAAAAGIGLIEASSLREDDIRDRIEALHADLGVVVAYGAIIPAPVLAMPRLGWVNLHFSDLPRWRGAAPVQWTLLSGDPTTASCVFRLEEGLDTGPLYSRVTRSVRPTDTAGDLLTRLADDGAGLVLATLATVADGTVRPEPQDDGAATLAPRLTTADGEVRWGDPALAVDRRVRGVSPAPGARTTYDGARFRLGPVTLVPEVTDLAPGELRATKHEVLVGTGSHAVRLGQVAPAGRSWMAADAWARGARPDGGARLGGDGRTRDGRHQQAGRGDHGTEAQE